MDSRGWDRRYAGSELVWTAEPNRTLAAEAADIPAGRALDVACGEGRNAVWLAQRGWQVTAVDFSQVGLDKAARLADERGVSVQWVLADLADYVPDRAAFDLVVILYLHVDGEMMREVLRRSAAALAPGGTMLVVGHDPTNIDEGYGGPQNPAILMAPDEIASALGDLQVERAERVRRPVSSAGEDVHAIDALVRAVRPPEGRRAARSAVLRRCAAAAAVIGGLSWTVKAGVTLATGDEPPLAFAIGFALFPFALLGLWSLVRDSGGRAARIGGALAVAAAVAVALAMLVRLIGGAAVEGGENEITVLTPLLVIGGFGGFAALLALGLAVRRTAALAAPLAPLPWAMGLAAIPLLMVGGALETVDARLLELPIALLGLAWVALGAALWKTAEQRTP